MKAAVRYYTQTGNTKVLAEAVAKAIGVEARDISCPLEEPVAILFLCNSVYWAGMDKQIKAFVRENASKIGTLVNVSTAALIESTYGQMKKVAAASGVNLCEKEFHCRGSFAALHRGHPNNTDLEAAAAFAREIVK